jgi:serine/threonine protein kinase
VRALAGTVVFEGQFEGRRVAVKRLQKILFETAEIERQRLLHADKFQYVIRFHGHKMDANFVYLILERCEFTLADAIQRSMFSHPEEQARCARQLLEGLASLHQENIIHRDIKPTNILVTENREVKIADLGSSECARSFSRAILPGLSCAHRALIAGRKIPGDRSSVRASVCGSQGWRAPETFDDGGVETHKKAIDVFSMGCVLYYLYFKGTLCLGPIGHGSPSELTQPRPPLSPWQASTRLGAMPSATTTCYVVRIGCTTAKVRRLTCSSWFVTSRSPWSSRNPSCACR